MERTAKDSGSMELDRNRSKASEKGQLKTMKQGIKTRKEILYGQRKRTAKDNGTLDKDRFVRVADRLIIFPYQLAHFHRFTLADYCT